MKIKRTKRDGIKIEHNKKLLWIIIILLILLVILIYFILQERGENEESLAGEECQVDADCVPAICCHSASCDSKDKAPKCDNLLCTMECSLDTLDCGQGECRCVEGRCGAVFVR